jgi:hypothetical protein
MRGKATRRVLVVISACALAMSLGAGTVLAGEITGSGKSLKNADGHLQGRSECAFSGLNDSFSGDPDVPDADGFFRTQNWGQVGSEGRAFLRSIGVDPAHACNPTGGN